MRRVFCKEEFRYYRKSGSYSINFRLSALVPLTIKKVSFCLDKPKPGWVSGIINNRNSSIDGKAEKKVFEKYESKM